MNTQSGILARTRRVMGLWMWAVSVLTGWAPIAVAQPADGWISPHGVPGADDTVRASIVLPDGDVLIFGDFCMVGDISALGAARYHSAIASWTPLYDSQGCQWFDRPRISCAVLLPDGDIIVGGRFRFIGDVRASNIARYRPSAGTWHSLGDGIEADLPLIPEVTSLLIAPDGRVVVGGAFSRAGGVAASSIAMVDPETGQWSAIGAGMYAVQWAWPRVGCLSMKAGGEMIVVGEFDSAGDVRAAGVAQYSFGSKSWSALGTGLAVEPKDGNLDGMSVIELSSGDVLVSGVLSIGEDRKPAIIARLRGGKGEWEVVPADLPARAGKTVRIRRQFEMATGEVLMLGDFVGAGATASPGIARFDPVSEVWSAVGTGLGHPRMFGAGYSVSPLSDYRAVIGGFFRIALGEPALNVAIVDFKSNTATRLASGFNGAISLIRTVADGTAVAVGDFQLAGSTKANYVAGFNSETRSWTNFGAGPSAPVTTMVELPDGDLVVGAVPGRLGVASPPVAERFDRRKGEWIQSSARFGGNKDHLSTSVVLPDGDVLFGGHFHEVGGVAAKNIVRWNPRTDQWSAVGEGSQEGVSEIESLPSGLCVVASGLSTADRPESPCIWLLNPQTSTWTSLGATVGDAAQGFSWIRHVAVASTGEIVVGGAFERVGVGPGCTGVAARSIAMYSPAEDRWFPLTETRQNQVYQVSGLERMPDGRILVLGAISVGDRNLPVNAAAYDLKSRTWNVLERSGYSYDSVAFLRNGDMLANARSPQMIHGLVWNFAVFKNRSLPLNAP